MMLCNNCNVNIVFRTDKCPLCGEKLYGSQNDPNEYKRLERAYPPLPQKSSHFLMPYELVSLIVFLNLMAVSVVLNVFLTPNIAWSALVGIGFLYLYFFIKGTITKSRRFNSRVVANAISLTVFFVAIEQIVKKNLYIYEFVIPAISVGSIIVLTVYIMFNIRVAGHIAISVIAVAVIGVFPFFVAISRGSAATMLIPSIVTLTISATTIIITALLTRQVIKEDIKRLFHI
ncbi:MAG: DUF6320 domain-containing protein [Christensenellaceae bacterium]|jgi:hypothetical protein|nr:DUF6320 domain-containing protein [Christensenellaceae bacterium]